MNVTLFLSAVLALLLAPGPTNTLIALAGARAGLRPMARLIPAELAGYLTAILPLAYVGGQVLAHWPMAASLLKLVAGAWVLLLALRLWRDPARAGAPTGVSVAKVYLTTMLNPKALVVALVLLPPPHDAQFLPRLVLFGLAVVGVALIWSTGGALTRAGGGSPARLRLLQRTASVWLAIVSGTLVVGALAA